MNNLLELKGKFEQESRAVDGFGAPNLPADQFINVSKLEDLLKNLQELKKYWENQNILPGALISVYYIKVVAKSNRIQSLLGNNSSKPNSSIVGAKFSLDPSPKHIITHYISREILNKSIEKLKYSIKILNNQFNGGVDYHTIAKINTNNIPYNYKTISKTNFLYTLLDAYYVEKFDIPTENINFEQNAIITIYKTEVETIKLLQKIGINVLSNRIIYKTTILLKPDELEILKHKAPFLISMAVSDLSEITKDNFRFITDNTITIDSPKNEPIIGVIDTLFDERVYFSKWVEYTNMLSNDIPICETDKEHGTAVSSIIVDGPSFNPELNDGCGRFRVRHFG